MSIWDMMNLCEGLGFNYLSNKEQQAYKLMLKAFSSMAVSVNCSQINRDVDLSKVLHTVLGDNPSVIYFDKTKIETEESSLEKHMYLTGIHPKPYAEKMILSLDATANKIVSLVKARAASNDEYSLLINLYEMLQKNVKYDTKELQAISKGVSYSQASHNAYGAIMNKLAVCDGYSSAFALLAQKLGFECMVVSGLSAYASTDLEDHAWNIIKIRNRCYHLDITWDVRHNEFSEFSYEYFLITDDEIANDHKWNKTAAPVCSCNDFSYYKKSGLYVNDTKELKNIVKTLGRNNSKIFRIKLSHNINLPNNAGDYLVQMALNEVAKPGVRTQASYGWNKNMRCFFAKVV